ncbi:probable beta-d-xylosidase 6 [Phtheirospermum japonicum]|uniref:Probable beta-d-xylosidase 6 n=1 Tax=Phtheirospermum japonicum TaxID=374723 RepID=A0A830C5Z2_9LAMI|nr:probable beta-d-xylosidase 6 [Phtheirospermum japonicum]
MPTTQPQHPCRWPHHNSYPSTIPHLSPLGRRENLAALQLRLRRPSAQNPAVRVVVGVPPRHRRQWRRRLLRRPHQIRHRIPTGHPLRRNLQSKPMVGGGASDRGGGEGDAWFGASQD